MKFAIYSRPLKLEVLNYVNDLLSSLYASEIDFLLYAPFYQNIKKQLSFKSKINTFSEPKEILQEIDMMITLGGDGTLLDTLHFVQDSGIPVLGINFGRLGFLASSSKKDIAKTIQQIKNKNYQLEKRSLLELKSNKKLFQGLNFALNECSISKRDVSAMIRVHVYIDGEFLNSYWADGLIIATPTGSTGYSMSCGGPIVLPMSNNFIITPIAPHNLNVRPIVIPDDKIITLKIENRNKDFITSLDSRTEILSETQELSLQKANFSFNLVSMNEATFINALRSKLLWGSDKRNF